MISDADYKELKGQEANLNDKGKAAVRDYEMLQAAKEPIEAPRAVRETAPAKVNVPELPPEQAPAAPAPDKLQAFSDAVNAGADDSMDASLPNASKLKALNTPPEYVAKSRMNGLKHIAAAVGQTAQDVATLGPVLGAIHSRSPLDANMYYEPSEEEFARDQAPVIRASGLTPGTDDYQTAFDVWKDKKWHQAYKQAEAEDRPLTRVAHVADNGSAWDKLKNYVEQAPDIAQSFAKGAADFLTLHQASALPNYVEDKLAGNHARRDESASQDERNPLATGAGEIAGSALPIGPVAEATGFVGKKLLGAAPGALRGLGRSVAGGVAGAVTDLAGRAAATGEQDDSMGSAKDRFMSGLLPTIGVAGGGSILGHLAAGGGNWLQKSNVQAHPEIADLFRGGGETATLRGVVPGEEVAANLEAARPPAYGENKPYPEANATEVQARKLREPLAAENATARGELPQRFAAEKDAAFAADPNLQKPVPVRRTAQGAVDWLLGELQPKAADAYFPLKKVLPEDVGPAANVSAARELLPQLVSGHVVTAADASGMAERNIGRSLTIEEAQKIGLDVPGMLKKQGLSTTIKTESPPATALDAEGVPNNAPAIPNEPLNVAQVLPKYSKEQLATAGGVGEATPEQAAAIQRYTFGKRSDGDNDLINEYLSKAPISPLPHVYRGLTLTPDQAAEMLSQDTFTTGSTPTSVSSSPIVARSFVARNLEPGDVGVTLKLEHASARNIQPFAHDQVKVEGELMLPEKRSFEIISKHKDPTNPGNWIVVAKEVPSATDAGMSTTEEVFGRPADKLAPGAADRLKPREGRAFKTPTGPLGSEWFDQAKAAETVALHSGDYAVSDPFGGWKNTVPSGRGPLDTPTTPGTPDAPPSVPSIRPTGAPSALRAADPPSLASAPWQGPLRQQETINGIPIGEYRVVIKPNEYNAQQWEKIIGNIDDRAGEGARARGKVDPNWEKLQAAARADRDQFGKPWTDLIARHHEISTQMEQRSGHAGLKERKPYSEMSPEGHATLNGQLQGYPNTDEARVAMRSIASDADARAKAMADLAGQAPPPSVLHELDILGAQHAYKRLSGEAMPKLAGTAGFGGVTEHIRGFGPAMRLRSDAVARAISRGPTGEPTISPRLADFLRNASPSPRPLTGMMSMGGGALGMKAGVGYNTARDELTTSQKQLLQRLIETAAGMNQATQEAP